MHKWGERKREKENRKQKTTHAGGDAAEDGGRNNHRLEHVGLRRHRNAVVHHLVHELPTASNNGQEGKGKKEREKKKDAFWRVRIQPCPSACA